MNTVKPFTTAIATTFATLMLAACGATQVAPEAQKIELTNALKNTEQCEYLGELIGSQGGPVAGDFTTDENLALGARNDLRYKAYEAGANVVEVQDSISASADEAWGTTKITVIGKAYKCM